MSILVFDSGIGGLSVFRELRIRLPDKHFIYVTDDAGFPYGNLDESTLVTRVVGLFEQLLSQYKPQVAIVACNTASTLILPALRKKFDTTIVGTVPAIKPAAERTQSGLVSLLGTPGTIKRQYTKELIEVYAKNIKVELVSAKHLAEIAENYLMQQPIDEALLQQEIAPCFVQQGHKRTDIVILGCTHYPFLANQMRRLAPWPVDWIEPAEAIAKHTQKVLSDPSIRAVEVQEPGFDTDLALFTSNKPSLAAVNLMRSFGLHLRPWQN